MSQNRSIYKNIRRGRPTGSTTHDAKLAEAFGATVRTLRVEQGVAQETLANIAGVERSHMGKIERGQHMPTLSMIFRISAGLGCSVATLMAAMEIRIDASTKDEA